jgi:hypothetical protein
VRGRPPVGEVGFGELGAGVDHHHLVDEPGRGRRELARPVQEGEGGLGDPHHARPEGALGEQPLQRQPDQHRGEPGELGERPTGALVGQHHRQQLGGQSRRSDVGGQRQVPQPRRGERGQRLAACARS